MLIQRTSPLTGKTNEMDLPITLEQIDEWKRGALIQDAMPQLTTSQREFMISGATDNDWDAMYPEDEEEEESSVHPGTE